MSQTPRISRRVGGGARCAALLLSLAVGTTVPQGADAQVSGGGGSASWAPVVAGARFGYDQAANGEVVGVQVRVPVLRSGHVEVVPNADVTFLTRLREYGFNLDAVYVTGGLQGGLYLGGGLAVRNSVFDVSEEEGRRNEAGFGAVVGARTGAPGRIGTQIEFRWIFLPGVDYDPRAATLGINFPLWGRRGPS